MSLKKKHNLSTYTYDAKSEKTFCESIPKDIKWSFQAVAHTWKYSEVHENEDTGAKKERSYNKRYTPDLNFGLFDLELKGFLRPDAKKRMEVFAKMHPEADLRIAFQQDKPITKKAKMTYTQWAFKHGFKSCIAKTFQELPEDWKEDAKKEKPKDE